MEKRCEKHNGKRTWGSQRPTTTTIITITIKLILISILEIMIMMIIIVKRIVIIIIIVIIITSQRWTNCFMLWKKTLHLGCLSYASYVESSFLWRWACPPTSGPQQSLLNLGMSCWCKLPQNACFIELCTPQTSQKLLRVCSCL